MEKLQKILNKNWNQERCLTNRHELVSKYDLEVLEDLEEKSSTSSLMGVDRMFLEFHQLEVGDIIAGFDGTPYELIDINHTKLTVRSKNLNNNSVVSGKLDLNPLIEVFEYCLISD